MAFKFFHASLEEHAPSIEQLGIRLNLEKEGRKLKGLTDLFNAVFNQHYKEFWPKGMPEMEMNRNRAIFLSARPDEFKKSENYAAFMPLENDIAQIKDIMYEVEMDQDLPALDCAIYNEWADQTLQHLNRSQLLIFYKNSATKDPKDGREEAEILGKIFTFLITEDFEHLEIFSKMDSYPEDTRAIMNRFRNSLAHLKKEIWDFTKQWVKKYCESGILTSQLIEYYEHQIHEGSISWKRKVDQNQFPEKIGMLEILCQVNIAREHIKRLIDQ